MSLKEILGVIAGFLLMLLGVGLKTKMDNLKKSAEAAERRAEEAEKEAVAVKVESETRKTEEKIFHDAVDATRIPDPEQESKIQIEKIRNQNPTILKKESADPASPAEQVESFQEYLASAAEELGRDDAGTSEYMLQHRDSRMKQYEERYGKKD